MVVIGGQFASLHFRLLQGSLWQAARKACFKSAIKMVRDFRNARVVFAAGGVTVVGMNRPLDGVLTILVER